MMRLALILALAIAGSLGARAEFADYVYVPREEKSQTRTAGPLAPETLGKRMQDDFPRHSIDAYAGRTEFLKSTSDMPALQVGAGVALDWTDTALFGPGFREGHRYHWRAAIASQDATALRLRVDLSRLGPDDAVWIVDPSGPHALGPYTFADAEPEGNWLPTIPGSETVIWATTSDGSPPDLTVPALSHFYEPLNNTKQNLPCPLTPDCVGGTAFQEVSTGIGRLTITDNDGSSAICSGALINNANTETLEAYFLTANHCFSGFRRTIFASGLEVVWDFRPANCTAADPGDEVLSQLPRSTGSAFLGTNGDLDGVLLQLNAVPVGTRGRAYLGWDTRTPQRGEAVAGIHHPSGNPMKASLGSVSDVNRNTGVGMRQTELRWNEGLTEQGSSGSPSLFDDGSLRIFGMLSSGTLQFCGDTQPRLDYYANFGEFFGEIGGFLTGTIPPNSGRSTYRDDGGPTTLRGCIQDTAKSPNVAGDILLSALAILTLVGLGKLRTP